MSQHRTMTHRFRSMHDDGILVLPNAWDAGSARVIEAAGARAIATTSAGVAWTYGVADGEHLTAEQAAEVVERIVRVVSVPVSADIEAGYGVTPDEVAATVEAIVRAGAVGFNIEDGPASNGEPLFTSDEQRERIRAARSVNPDVVINARTDVYLRGVGEADTRLEHAVQRLNAYRAAGADCLFCPGVGDAGTISALAAALDGPLNIMVDPGSLPVDKLQELGVRRVSLGISIALGALGFAHSAAQEALEHGTYDRSAGGMTFGDIQALLAPVS